MFVGHLAVALGAKRVEPRLPLGAAVAATFGLDLLWPLFLLLGLERVRVDPGNTAFTQLAFDSYPWSHSLLLTLVWGGLATWVGNAVLGALRLGLILGGLVVSHWVLDFVVHRPDLPLWPGGVEVGLGLWRSVPATLAAEGFLLALAVVVYVSMSRPRDAVGTFAFAALVLTCTLLWMSGPFAPPPPSAAAVAWGSLALWLLPPWARWVERHRELPGEPSPPGAASP